MSNYEITVYIGAFIATVFLIVGYFLIHKTGEQK